jgi:predicted dehydrogenase
VLRFALLGCGRIAARHARILASGLDGSVKLAAVCDVQAERARRLGEEHGVPWFGDVASMMQYADADVVVVLTPSGLHAQHVLELARYGRHVIVEKPLALTLDDADRMIAAVERAGARLFVVLQNRFNLPVVAVRGALDAGRFGRIVLGTVRVRWCRTQGYYDQDTWRGTWALDGGVFANQAIHHVDLLCWLLGEPESVVARTSDGLVDIEATDTGVAIVKFISGALGVIEATNSARPVDLEGSLSLLGERGAVEIGGFAVNQIRSWRFETELPADRDVVDRLRENPPDVYGFGHAAFLRHVVDAIEGNRPSMLEGAAGRPSLALVHAMYRSAETGGEVWLRDTPVSTRLGRP